MQARVEAAGGQILFWNGVRVMGVLAVSRAIGDHCLRPFVIAQPEVTIFATAMLHNLECHACGLGIYCHTSLAALGCLHHAARFGRLAPCN